VFLTFKAMKIYVPRTKLSQGKINYDYFYDLDFSRFLQKQKQISVQVEEEKTKSTFEKYTKRPKTIRDRKK